MARSDVPVDAWASWSVRRDHDAWPYGNGRIFGNLSSADWEIRVLYAAEATERCERLYYIEDHSAQEHRFEVLEEGRPGTGNDGYACLANVVVGW